MKKLMIIGFLVLLTSNVFAEVGPTETPCSAGSDVAMGENITGGVGSGSSTDTAAPAVSN